MNVTTKVVFGVISTALFILAACLLAATIALGWLYGTQRNPEGFVESTTVSMSTDGYAITSTDLDLGSLPDEWFPTSAVGTFQVQVQSSSESPVFVGVGPSSEVGEFLADVDHTEVTRFGNQSRISYTEHAGSVSPEPPAALGFWTVSSEGTGRQTLDWEPTSGQWTLVVMNSDATSGLDVSASLGVDTPWLAVGMWTLGALTVLITAGAAVMAALASRQRTEVDAKDAGTVKPAPLSG